MPISIVFQDWKLLNALNTGFAWAEPQTPTVTPPSGSAPRNLSHTSRFGQTNVSVPVTGVVFSGLLTGVISNLQCQVYYSRWAGPLSLPPLARLIRWAPSFYYFPPLRPKNHQRTKCNPQAVWTPFWSRVGRQK